MGMKNVMGISISWETKCSFPGNKHQLDPLGIKSCWLFLIVEMETQSFYVKEKHSLLDTFQFQFVFLFHSYKIALNPTPHGFRISRQPKEKGKEIKQNL